MSDRIEKLSELKKNQLDELDNWLTFQLKLDCDEESYKELKRDVYLLYAECISELVSKIEVYFHELPMFLYDMNSSVTGSGYKASVWGKIEKVLFWISVILSVYGTMNFFI